MSAGPTLFVCGPSTTNKPGGSQAGCSGKNTES